MSENIESHPLLSLDEIAERAERVVSTSVADETSIAWLESHQDRFRFRRGPGEPRQVERAILVRVMERGRLGCFRTCSPAVSDLESAVRMALAHARFQDRLPGLPHLPRNGVDLPQIDKLWDPAVAGLTPELAKQRLGGARDGESARLDWCGLRAVVVGRGLVRRTQATRVSLEVRTGRHEGIGFAAATSRQLADLPIEDTFQRARRFDVGGATARGDDAACVPVLLAAEAAAQVVSLLNRTALTARSYREGDSFLREHLGVQVFDRRFSLFDDGTDPAGLPFPFDREGTAKSRLELISDGTPRSPALDHVDAAGLGLPATPHAWTGDDAYAEHLFVSAGTDEEEELLRAAEGGVHISLVDRLECFDPRRVLIRGIAHGVRRIRDGQLAEALPDQRWETSLLRSLGTLGGVGRQRQRIAAPGSLVGSICCPALLLNEPGELTPQRRPRPDRDIERPS